jgi:radical SAM superfamily enzyme YgiQ (UPF0313 family)
MIDKGITFLSVYDSESYALRILAAILKRQGYSSRQIYFKKLHTPKFPYTSKEFRMLVDLLAKFQTKLLCVSLRSSSLKTFSSLFDRIKKSLPGINILMGGTHPTIIPEDALDYADAICIGDGEETIVEVAKSYTGDLKSLSGIKGVWVKYEEGKVERSDKRGVFADLDSLPIEIYEDQDKYFIENDTILEKDPLVQESSVEVFASRGCPRQCTYCSNSILSKIVCLDSQKFLRLKQVRSVIKDMAYIKKRFKNIRRLIFADEVFGLNKDWVKDFCRLYPQEIGLPFSALFHVSLVNEGIIKQLKQAGLSHARVGVQSGSGPIRRELYRRMESQEEIISAGKLFKKIGIRFSYDFIVNNPYEGEADKFSTLELLAKLPRPFEINLHSLVYFPNTVLTDRAISDNIIGPENIEGKYSCQGLFFTDSLVNRKENDIFWNSLFSLSSKDFIHRKLLLLIANSQFLKKRKLFVLYLARIATIVKMGQMSIHFIIKKEMTVKDVCKTALSMLGKPLTSK